MISKQLPAYGQVKTFIKSNISNGSWRPGDSVPSESVLMAQFGVSRMTVNRALRELMGEGMVTRIQGSGTFVAELHHISSTLKIRDIYEEVVERGHIHTSRLLHADAEKATADLADTLGLRSGRRVFHTIMVHFENGIPIQYEDRYVNPIAAPDYLKTDFSQTTPTRYLLQEAPLTEANYSIEACIPTAIEAQVLEIKSGEPCLVMVRRTVSGVNIASVARLVYPSSRYSLTGKF
jgi:GntR family transcriptional regulator, histidine utilization repressor